LLAYLLAYLLFYLIINLLTYLLNYFFSTLDYWLGDRKGIQPVKNLTHFGKTAGETK